MVDISRSVLDPICLNLETNLNLYLYCEKCIKFNQSESRIISREIWNLRAIEEYCTETGGEISNFEKTGFDFLLLYPKKSGLSKKLKVSILDIRIKQSGLKVSHSKVPCSVCLFTTYFDWNIRSNIVFWDTQEKEIFSDKIL